MCNWLLGVSSMRLLSKRKQTHLEPLEDGSRAAKRRKTDQVCKLVEFPVMLEIVHCIFTLLHRTVWVV